MPLHLAAAAIKLTPFDFEGNFKQIQNIIEISKTKNIDLICFPELCLSGYGCEDGFFYRSVAEDCLETLKKLLGISKGISFAVGIPIYFEDVLYNGAAFIANEELLGIACKQNLANNGVHYEKRWFTPWKPKRKGTLNVFGNLIPIGDIRISYKGEIIGFEICEDAWVDNRPVTCEAAKEITIFLNPSASHFSIGKWDVRRDLTLKGSEIAQCAYIYANQLGNEAGRIIYDGDAIIAYKGRVLAESKRLSFNDYHLVDFDLSNVSKPALASQNYQVRTKDRDYIEFTKAASLGLFDYLKKSGAKKFILSLSGGADSTAVACLVRAMIEFGVTTLGEAKFCSILNIKDAKSKKDLLNNILTCVYQGTEQNSDITRDAAAKISNLFGFKFFEYNISDLVKSYIQKIEVIANRKLSWETDDIALQNIQARVRSPGIWMLANIEQALLLNTGNRSESSVGYSTMDGDTSGSISPIAGVSKHFIQGWLKWLQTNSIESFGPFPELEIITSQAPTAELRPLSTNQTDEKDLMPYEVLDFFENIIIKEKLSSKICLINAAQEFNDKYSSIELKNWLNRFYTLFRTSQWKRDRLAPSFHLDDFSVDSRSWLRYPILSKNLSFGF